MRSDSESDGVPASSSPQSPASGEAVDSADTPAQRKQQLRREIRRRLRGLSPAKRAEASTAICRRLQQLPELRSADRIFLYSALPDEVDTLPLARWARERGIQLGYPVVDPRPAAPGSPPHMEFRILPPDMDPAVLDGVSADILPAAVLRPSDSSIIAAPGRAFSPAGARLGRGGGYYDSYIARWRRLSGCRAIGLGFSQQIFASVPVHEHDERMDYVCSELELYRS